MKALKRIKYSEDVDILTIQLSDKKIDDSYDTEYGIVSVAEDGEPILLEIFNAGKFLKDLNKAIPKKIQRELWSTPVSVAHRIK
ncbi:DUF2283 domain-containing protein [Candidatus Daviesbacteria bacterium]|nr:DUF2283 domain-containing protein [Candidatus Daviesbacteria bacterium]